MPTIVSDGMKDFDEPSVSNSALPVVSSPSSAFTFEFEIPEHPASPFQAALPPRFLRRFQKPTEDVLPNDNEGQLDLNGTMPFRFGPPRPQTASDTDSESDQESGSGSESELDIESVPIALRKHQNRPSIYTDEHKDKVKATNEKYRDKMEKELSKIRGYTTDSRSFQNGLSRETRLEMLEKRNTLKLSPSLIKLRSTPSVRSSGRPRSVSDDENVDHSDRALTNARDTLRGPEAPESVIPSFDQLQISSSTDGDPQESDLSN